ncbi:ABC transporter substrate-binding protein [Pseudomonas juntendi]|uniref:ABC transporter substrate-binding protein n=1 Tax=Pseudomonas juntendi TaxID=2666183 RepID=A0A7W2LLT2_9PSED|nr:ABC transporter substrate-binding protein [Pseudomonas juntendi]MBA6143250.1 ABC transporter substrate-binding protein [Pseudomonas juntendi]NOY02533.1 ABC transporter substrate-binding protein [Gammaproteobacteria bacterium]NPA20068.1 ABC transporter substrate-binding protein [Gammaproteobacteria bacterium]QEQ89103.1 ABC transporter substrate-binding protein [Pseudomonas putida]
MSRISVSPAFTFSRTFLLAASLGLGAWQTAMAAVPADTLMVGKPADPQTLDPGVTFDNNDWTITYPVYQRLMKYKVEGGKGSTEVEGDLASEWSTSDDNLVWTFKLKPGNKFDDGAAVDATAVKYSVERLMKLKQGPSSIFPEDITVDVVDPVTVKFTLKKPFAPFLFALAHNGASIVNPDVEKHEKDVNAWLATHTAGSGAYRLASWQKGQSLTLEPNPHYSGKAPSLKKVVVRIIAEPSVRRLQLEQGDLDIIEDVPEDQVQALAKEKGYVTTAYPSLRVTYLYLNNKRPPLNDANARKAIVDALDYQGIVDGIAMGKAKLMNGPIPDGMWGYDSSLPAPKQDVDAAQQALSKASKKVSQLQFVYSDKDPAWEPIGLTLQAGLEALGVHMSMDKLANATLRERLGSGDFDIAIGNWSPDFADPYMFMNFWFDSANAGLAGNRSFYNNPKVDTLVREAASVNNVEQRMALYQQAQKIVVSDSAYAYIYQKSYTAPMREKVKGYVFNPMLEQVFDFAAMSK